MVEERSYMENGPHFQWTLLFESGQRKFYLTKNWRVWPRLFLEFFISKKLACLFVHNRSLAFSGPYLKYKYFTNVPPHFNRPFQKTST